MATLNTSYGEIALRDAYYGLELSTEDLYSHLNVPNRNDPNELVEGATFALHGDRWDQWDDVQMQQAQNLLAFARQLCAELNAAMADDVEAAKQRQKEEEAEAERKAAERSAELGERAQRLMTEFLGEKGRVRLRGYKRWRPVTVDTREMGEGEYEPMFNYVYPNKHGYTEYWGHHVVGFQIKVGSRYQTVWDNDQEDLSVWDRKDSKAPDYDGGLA